jgi:hypothetical protein
MTNILLFSFIGIGIMLFIFRLANIAYKRMLIPVEKVDAGTAEKHISTNQALTQETDSFQDVSLKSPETRTNLLSYLKNFFIPETRITNAFYTISPFESFYYKGKKINPKNYIITRVDGNCMVPRNIHSGDLLFIEKFEGNSNTLSKGDILFIEREEGGFKIREYREKDPNDDKRVKTILYQENGIARDSSEPHKLSNIKGIVKMRFVPN